METKICVECGIEKPLDNFGISFAGQNAKNGFNQNENRKHRCKTCYSRRDRTKIKLDFLEAYGMICACCGEDDVRFLNLDHINNDGGKQRRELKLNEQQIYRLAKQEGYPKDKYQILCFNCNMGRSCNGGICPHKDISKEEYLEKLRKNLYYVGKQFVKTNLNGLKLGPQKTKESAAIANLERILKEMLGAGLTQEQILAKLT